MMVGDIIGYTVLGILVMVMFSLIIFGLASSIRDYKKSSKAIDVVYTRLDEMYELGYITHSSYHDTMNKVCSGTVYHIHNYLCDMVEEINEDIRKGVFKPPWDFNIKYSVHKHNAITGNSRKLYDVN